VRETLLGVNIVVLGTYLGAQACGWFLSYPNIKPGEYTLALSLLDINDPENRCKDKRGRKTLTLNLN